MPHVLNTVVHLVNLVAYSFTLYYAFKILHIPFLEKKFSDFETGQFKYLTMWDVVSSKLALSLLTRDTSQLSEIDSP
ncbi:Uncharacterized protein DBV15_02022 [Temnothorax longispinosus]|uniref:Uncharacterized protein n=1 Tax=Temnothorax longispinosus TaxID=300112 RepID=A0A4S2KJ71_9HYME|nr:Uncharacterized protein DBV15_02022 [Temnothorax longispinosus]